MKENLKYYIETWGCQMNEEDSEKISGMLKIKEFNRVYSEEEADVIVFNTCCVRENAEQKVFGHLGILKNIKEKKPSLIIAVCGCMIQQEGMAETIAKKYPFVNLLIGTHNSYMFPQYLDRLLKGEKQIVEVWEKEGQIINDIPIDRLSPTKAFVTIMYGCNNFCTYCIVPYVRGRERSRKPEDIENEIINLVNKGYKEVTLLGQNVNSYGKGLEPHISFADLLRRLNKIQGLERIRFMTSHPKDLSHDVIDAISQCEKVCDHVHLPVQSGSTELLKKMNRNYTREHYLDLIKEIREKIPTASITTDIIVGFPGETEEDFNETLKLIQEVKYDSVFTFLYSRREGTPAFDFEDQIPEDVKHQRFERLVQEVNKICEELNKEYYDRVVPVLVEGVSKNDKNMLTGRTTTAKLVNFKGNKDSIGKVVNVKITKTKSFSLLGEEIQ
ncbi:tRNA-i(6)A37 thiotransferase enzyme MiaB [Hathewaya proteolytica DSM 3090]|uniref:tRNA-2-methylthio-N(6)-dimethylallyladenosine synthase n=1 Tax=Hathewaya proteolytica DSM 3090 TaxID=1121331 RepID=A0A1M6J3C0_9CLOT|nr:tRNA (N6-isopentenyl adenosine(37)-C2)-methylthiotransferase MiaB [Hathewaya proteolytica]SHJ41196.1 tRNA-i(6)A37 thiotransferase enzyme MiaB [Hathewaya proteolytica DSM 3090]